MTARPAFDVAITVALLLLVLRMTAVTCSWCGQPGPRRRGRERRNLAEAQSSAIPLIRSPRRSRLKVQALLVLLFTRLLLFSAGRT